MVGSGGGRNTVWFRQLVVVGGEAYSMVGGALPYFTTTPTSLSLHHTSHKTRKITSWDWFVQLIRDLGQMDGRGGW